MPAYASPRPADNIEAYSPTRITMPATSVDDREPDAIPGYSSSQSHLERIESSSFEESVAAPPEDDHALDELWWTLRRKKEQKMARERCKVQSLEEPSPEAAQVDIPPIDEPKPLKRQKSVTSFRESPDGRTVVASFDMRGVPKENVHVSYQRHRVVVTWVTVEVSEWEEDGRIVRERSEKNFQRTLPLPEGTRFEEISGAMSGKHLLLRYPNSRSFRVENRSTSGGS